MTDVNAIMEIYNHAINVLIKDEKLILAKRKPKTDRYLVYTFYNDSSENDVLIIRKKKLIGHLNHEVSDKFHRCRIIYYKDICARRDSLKVLILPLIMRGFRIFDKSKTS